AGYLINQVLVDGSDVGDVSSYTFSDVADNHTIEASFIKDIEAAVETQATEVVISWNEVPSATHYIIIIYIDQAHTQIFDSHSITASGQAKNSVMRASDNRLSCIVSGLSPETHYWYTITAMHDSDPIAVFTESFETAQIPTSLEEVAVHSLQIFPSPAQSDLFIQSKLPIKKVEICSLAGTLVLSESNFTGKISVSALPQGVYLVKVHTDKGLIVRKFTKK
ncbi:MAG: T9SS type A sorting domain-containing protein, partial [Candidatus Azobacteroides sp.]|nr:T9SS type A sorting domain-containing protein [Candidatus Azobacteroides sp.]